MAKARHFSNSCARLAVCVLLMVCTSAAERPPYRPDRLLIKPLPGASAKLQSFQRAKSHRGKNVVDEPGGIQLVHLESGEDPLAAAEAYQASGLVEFAEPDYLLRASSLPSDPEFSEVWSLQGGTDYDTDAPDAWDVRTSAENVVVAVIDSGVRYTHEDLAENMWRNPNEIENGEDDDNNGVIDDLHGYNAIDRNGDPNDDNGHGTHVAGTIGAVGNNDKGIAGVCWKVKIMALKFMDAEGYGDTSDAIACINYARRYGARVINASWGSDYGSYSLRSAIANARNAGIIFVTAAGNESANNDLYPSYPANYSLNNIVSVAATDQSGGLDRYYSNFGARTVDLAAPGTEIYSTWNSADDAYLAISGTSMAAPHVTGAIALLQAAYPKERYTNILSRLYAATDKLPSLSKQTVTGGRLNIGKLFPKTNLQLRLSWTGGDSAQIRAGTLRLTLPEETHGLRLESSPDLIQWLPVEPEPSTTSGEIELNPTESRRFYRLAVPSRSAD